MAELYFEHCTNEPSFGLAFGVLSGWDHSFHWTGLSTATWYELEMQTTDGTSVFSTWYMSEWAGCAGE